MFFLVFIIVFVLYLLAVVVINFPVNYSPLELHGYAVDNVVHNTVL